MVRNLLIHRDEERGWSKLSPMLGQGEGMQRDLRPEALTIALRAIGDLVWRGAALAQRFEPGAPLAALGVI
jgi:hypothetical protein